MMGLWQLPDHTIIEGKKYKFHPDFRDILEIFSYFSDPDLTEFVQWEIALALFYREDIQPAHRQRAMEYLAWFVAGGKTEAAAPGPVLLDWQRDAALIAADINKVSGQEVRSLPFVHWWTFLSWFNAIGQGQLSTVVAIRSKLAKGQKLENWEQEFYRENRSTVELPKRYSRQQLQEKQRLEKLLQ